MAGVPPCISYFFVARYLGRVPPEEKNYTELEQRLYTELEQRLYTELEQRLYTEL